MTVERAKNIVSRQVLDISVTAFHPPESSRITITKENSLKGKSTKEKTVEKPFSAHLSIAAGSPKAALAAIGVEHPPESDVRMAVRLGETGLTATISYPYEETKTHYERCVVSRRLVARAGDEVAPYCRANEDVYEDEYSQVPIDRTLRLTAKKSLPLEGEPFTLLYSGLKAAAADGQEKAVALLAFLQQHAPSAISAAKAAIKADLHARAEQAQRNADDLRALMEEADLPAVPRAGNGGRRRP